LLLCTQRLAIEERISIMSSRTLAKLLVTETASRPRHSAAHRTDLIVDAVDASVLDFPKNSLSAENTERRNGFRRTRALLWAADGAIALGAGLLADVAFGQPLGALFAVLWLAYMTIRHTRDGRMADLTDRRRIVSINGHFVLLITLAVLVYPSTGINDARWAVGMSAGMAGLAMAARWSLTRPAVRSRFGLSLDERVIVVGDRESVTRTIAEWEGIEQFSIVGVCLSEADGQARSVMGIPVLGTVAEVAEVVARIDVDIVAVHDVDKLGGLQLAKLQWVLEEYGAHLSVITPVTNTVEGRATVRRAGRRLIVDLTHGRPRGVVAALKGAVDRTLGTVLLLAALPFIAVCVVAIKLTSPGPAIFKQVRVRERGETFTVYKLRTMSIDAESRLAELLDGNEVGGGLFKMKADPRVTSVGVWLRRLSLDELPQLWNVVIGDMSLIGPRPALPHEVETYDEWARRRLAVKPGLTGLWQVSGRSNLSWTDSVRLDSDYVDNWCPGRDVSIALRTVKAVLTRDGAH
jgi:exopolysaccharide biosynthesis polyprenyl glycosylphosphotransferase